MKKFLAALLCLAMLCGMMTVLASCTGGGTDTTPPASDTTKGDETPDSKGYEDDGKTYSYRLGPSSLPTTWNYHTYQSNDATYILDYASDGLLAFEYNKDFTGYEIVPSMAKDFPTDVTSEYVGKYGIKEGDVNKAWKITLKDGLKFDNGEKLDANSFVASMKLLLNPKASNYRADNVYKSGDLKIYNSEAYVKQNKYNLGEFVSAAFGDDEYVDPSKFTTEDDGRLTYNGQDIVIDLNNGGNWGNELSLYASRGYLGSDLIKDEASGRVAVFDTNGTMVLTRSEEKDTKIENKKTGETVDDWTFYDLEGNKVTRYIDEEGATVYLDKDGNVKKEWAGCSAKFDTADAYKALEAAADENGWVKLNATTLKAVQDCVAMLHGFENVEAYAAKKGNYAYIEFEEMAFFGKVWDSISFEDVGFFATSDNELVVVLKNAMADNFYLRYELCTSFFLVYAPLYESLIKETGGVYSNTYGTSVETFVGYGPYKLTKYEEGSQIVLERNLNWHGYAAGEYKAGTYMTDRIVYNKVDNDATRLEMFLKGQLDSYGLNADDMKDYLTSDYTYFNDSESTWYLAMNPDMANLTKVQEAASPVNAGYTVNKTVLTIQAFRQALSYALDRTDFNQQLNPTSGVAKALLSSMIVADPESGRTYRSLDEAKDAILNFWGLADQWGEGKKYATRDDAIASITGYDPDGAKVLYREAYDTAVKDGLLTQEMIDSGKWEVQIVIGKPSEGNFYNKGYEFLKACWTKSVEGTPFEGHLTFVQSQTLGSSTFGTYLREGQVDVLFGVGYGGSMFNPYTMMDCFTGSLQYDPFTKKEAVSMDVTLDGKVLRASLYDWVSECLQGNTIKAYVVVNGEVTDEVVEISAGASDPAARRITILATAEQAIMQLANIFPMMTDASASLRCMRINYKTEDYVVGMGRGGLEWYTYGMDDAEFADYVSQQPGGVLNYK